MKVFSRLLIFFAVALLVYGIYYARTLKDISILQPNSTSQENVETTNPQESIVGNEDVPQVSEVVTGLDTPWAIDFLPDGSMLVTERKGTVQLVDQDGSKKEVANISSVKEIREGGLQGIATHPNFNLNKYVYVYYTFEGEGANTLNRVSRFTFGGVRLEDEEIVLDNIPGAGFHDGGRIKFGPDGMLYITTGDAQEPSLAQDTGSLAGKILRVNDDGTPAEGNPFGNHTYSYGHRNPQGIAWDSGGQLWSTEHGPSGVQTGNDEINKIEPGKNYGWPDIKGTQTAEGMETPVLESGFLNTWAPAGLGYLDEKFYFAGLRGSALYELDSNGRNLKTHFKGEFGRLREVVVGPDNMLYVTTSNLDGRGSPKEGDDKILRINPSKL